MSDSYRDVCGVRMTESEWDKRQQGELYCDCECADEVNDLKSRLRKTAQILIESVGAEGPMNAEDAARKVAATIEKAKTESAEYVIRNLLAVIHGDGGHRQSRENTPATMEAVYTAFHEALARAKS